MKIIYYDFENQLSRLEIKKLLNARIKELMSQNFTEEDALRIIFGSEKFKASFIKSEDFEKTKSYYEKHLCKK